MRDWPASGNTAWLASSARHVAYLVHETLYEDFVEGLAAETVRIKVGDGFDPASQMGPLANRRRLAAMEEFVSDAVSHGARIVTGGSRMGNRGWFFAPTVLADVPLEAQIMTEEIFGPISPCMKVGSMEEALAISNSLETGLPAFVFSNSTETATGWRMNYK